MIQPKTPSWRYRVLFGIVGTAILAVAAYYVGTVWRARLRTPELVRSLLVSEWIDMQASELSSWQKCALLTVQDPSFYDHSGVRRPLWKALTGTTITQAIVKRLYFEDFKPGIRKIRQTLIARYALDPLVSKEDQLTLFLNLTWFYQNADGEPIFGFADAARAYFGKPLALLSEEQYLSLVAMLIGPERYNPRTHPRENAGRVASLKAFVIDRCGPKN